MAEILPPATPAPASPVDATAKAAPAKVDALFDKAKAAAADPAKPAEAPKPVEDSRAKHFALLAKEQRRVAEEKAALAKDRASHTARLAAADQLENLKKELADNPVKALRDLGLDYDKLVKAEMQRQDEESNPTMRKVRELEQQLAERGRKEKEDAARYAQMQHQRLVDEHVGKIREHIAANLDKYEFLSTYKAEEDVFARIKKTFDDSLVKDKDGRITAFKELTVAEACDELEAEYDESVQAIVKLKKVQARLAPPAKTNDKKEAPAATPKQKSVTLNNAADPSTPHQMSREERRERAWRALHGEARN